MPLARSQGSLKRAHEIDFELTLSFIRVDERQASRSGEQSN